jgi:predicted RNase H-like HicB family nuclease
MTHRYSIVIQWCEEDQIYVVSLPEFGSYAHTHGKTYEEALTMAQECLETLIDGYEATGRALPVPHLFDLGLVEESLQVA